MVVALSICKAPRVLSAVKLNNQSPVTAGEIDIVRTDRLLADEFEPAKLPTANPPRKFGFGRREGNSQQSGLLGLFLVLAAHPFTIQR